MSHGDNVHVTSFTWAGKTMRSLMKSLNAWSLELFSQEMITWTMNIPGILIMLSRKFSQKIDNYTIVMIKRTFYIRQFTWVLSLIKCLKSYTYNDRWHLNLQLELDSIGHDTN